MSKPRQEWGKIMADRTNRLFDKNNRDGNVRREMRQRQ